MMGYIGAVAAGAALGLVLTAVIGVVVTEFFDCSLVKSP